jgi:O-antigen/teichoic acid export membrane protein
MPTKVSGLTSGRRLARSTVWNLIGQLTPMAAGVVCVPPLVHGLGVDRFGILSLAWIIIGYFSLFDLGIGRAVTKLVADRLGAGEEDSIPQLVWTSLLLMLLMGILGGVVTLGISSFLVQRGLKVPLALKVETLHTFYLLALSIPVVTLTSGLRGVLEAQQRFGIATIIRIPLSIFSFTGPLAVMPFSHSLVPVVAVLVAGRICTLVPYLLACLHTLPALRHNFNARRSEIRPLLNFGSWITVSNVLGPLVGYIDRFLIGALLSLGAVAYYTAPLDMVSRLTVIPGALAGVLFPAFAVSLLQDSTRTSLLLNRSLKYVLLAIFPIVLVILVLAPDILRLWLGPSFAQNSSLVLRWLAAGVFVNCFGQIPFALVQSAGRPDLTAKLYMIELPVYAGLIWVFSTRFGIEGVAIAWAIRVTLDALVLFFFTWRVLPQKPQFLPKLAGAVAAGLLIMFVEALPRSMATRGALLVVTLITFALLSWFHGLGKMERRFFLRSGARELSSVREQT